MQTATGPQEMAQSSGSPFFELFVNVTVTRPLLWNRETKLTSKEASAR